MIRKDTTKETCVKETPVTTTGTITETTTEIIVITAEENMITIMMMIMIIETIEIIVEGEIIEEGTTEAVETTTVIEIEMGIDTTTTNVITRIKGITINIKIKIREGRKAAALHPQKKPKKLKSLSLLLICLGH